MKRHIQDRFAFGGVRRALRSGLIERHREIGGARGSMGDFRYLNYMFE